MVVSCCWIDFKTGEQPTSVDSASMPSSGASTWSPSAAGGGASAASGAALDEAIALSGQKLS